MLIRELLRALRRRWYLVIGAFVIAAGVGLGLAQVVSPTYRSSASMVLVPPETTLGDTGNPYLFLGGLDQTVDVLARSLNSGDSRATIEEAMPEGASYEAVADFTTSAPIVLVTVQTASPEQADPLLDVVLEEVSGNLQQLQNEVGVSGQALIESQVVSRDAEPEALQKPRLRRLAMATIAVLTVLLLMIAAVDSILRRRGTT